MARRSGEKEGERTQAALLIDGREGTGRRFTCWRHRDVGGEVAAGAHHFPRSMGTLRRPARGPRKSRRRGMGSRERERERRVNGDCGEWSGVREIFPGETATGDVVVALEGRRKERRVRRWSTRGSGVGIGEGGMARGAFGWARVKLGRETAQVRGRGEGRPGGPRAPAWAAPKRKRERGRFGLWKERKENRPTENLEEKKKERKRERESNISLE